MIKSCLIGVLLVVTFAAPFCVLPVKDSIEELTMRNQQKFNSKQNFFVTFGIITCAYVIALTVPTIADAMTILGATTNTFVGFLLPIIFYLKILGARGGSFSNKKILAYIIFVLVCCSSVIELFTFTYKKINTDDECSA